MVLNQWSVSNREIKLNISGFYQHRETGKFTSILRNIDEGFFLTHDCLISKAFGNLA